MIVWLILGAIAGVLIHQHNRIQRLEQNLREQQLITAELRTRVTGHRPTPVHQRAV